MRKIALRGLIGQKRNTALLWSVVALSFLFLVLSTTIITSLQETDERQRNETYGKWQVMAADFELTGTEYYEGGSGLVLSEEIIEAITSKADESIVLPMVSVSGVDYFSGDNEYYITPYSDDFIESGNLTLKEGYWPKEKNEIALEYARLSSLNLKLGDTFTVVSQVTIDANSDYIARLGEISELAKDDIIKEGIELFNKKAWNEVNNSVLNFNKTVYEEFFLIYPGQREGSVLSMYLADDEHPNGRIIPFDEMTEEQFVRAYTGFIDSSIGIDITGYMIPHMTEEEINYFFGLTADLIGYENLNIRVTINKKDIIINIPFTYKICGVVDTFSDRWDTGMLPLPSGFVTEENYLVYINGQKKVLEKYDKFSFKPYNSIVFLSDNAKNSARTLWNDVAAVIEEKNGISIDKSIMHIPLPPKAETKLLLLLRLFFL